MCFENYKTDVNQGIVKNESLNIKNEHNQKLQIILNDFQNFHEIPFEQISSFSEILITFLKEAIEDDFSVLCNNYFMQQLQDFLLKGSKPIIYTNCLDALNTILENTEAKNFINPFLDQKFVSFIFEAATYIPNNETPPIPPIIYSSQKNVYSKLIQVMLNIFEYNLDIFIKIQPPFSFYPICQLYQRDLNLSASVKALEFIFYILSKKELKFSTNDLAPIFQMTKHYFSFLIEHFNQPIVYTFESFPYLKPFTNCQGCSPKFSDFSKMCQIVIQLAQRDLDYFYKEINIYTLFPLLSSLNQICSCSLIDLIIYILSLPNVPDDFKNTISWNHVDAAMNNLKAIQSDEPDFVIKVCQLIEALVPHKEIQIEQLNDLFLFIQNGSVKMQQEALRVTCNLFLRNTNQLLKLNFQVPLSEYVLFAIFDSFETTDDLNYIELLLLTLLKIINCFNKKNDFNIITKIQEFCSSEFFDSIFDREDNEEIESLRFNLLKELNI